jgi:long-chain fatty acid transport protein
VRNLSRICIAVGSVCFTTSVVASDFNLPFINSSGLGVAYADWATATNDASTSYSNPAGLVHLPHQQLMINALEILGTTQFTGTSVTPPFAYPNPVVQSGTAKSQIKAFSPSVFYSRRLTSKTAFGFGITAPFGLGTNYGVSSIARYTAVNAKVAGIDIGASLGAKLTDALSIGFGLDALQLSFTLNNMYGPPLSVPADSELQNKLSGLGIGWHGGILYQVAPKTRLGLSYNSKFEINTTGKSSVFLPSPVSTEVRTSSQATNAALPAHAQLSIQHDFTPRWTGMSTVFYTNWKTFNQIEMQNTMTPNGSLIRVIIPFNYHNCFDYSVGATFKATDKWLLRGGLQLLNTPSNNHDRGIADPIGNATILTMGMHFKQNEALGYDLGIGHSFFKQMPINVTNALTSLIGHTNTQTTVIGAQINWNIA